MSGSKSFELGIVLRAVAVWGSAIAAALFVRGFATDHRLLDSLELSLKSKVAEPNVLVYLGLLVILFSFYSLAGNRDWELTASLLAVGTVVGIYSWCKLSLNFYPDPYLLSLALPPLCRIPAALARRKLESRAGRASAEAVVSLA